MASELPKVFYVPYSPETAVKFRKNETPIMVFRKKVVAQLYGGAGVSILEVYPKSGVKILYEGTTGFLRIRRGYDPKVNVLNQLNPGESAFHAINQAKERAGKLGYHAISFLSDDAGTHILDARKFRLGGNPEIRKHHKLLEAIHELMPDLWVT